MSHRQSVMEVFDRWARAGRADGMERSHRRGARAAFDRLAVGAGDRYLDIGCGNGYSVRWAAEAGAARAVGLDLSADMIEIARERSAGIDAVELVCDAFPSASLEPASFDAVLSVEAFYYIDDLDGALVATAALLVPGGRFACVIDHYAENQASHSWAEDLGLSLHLLDSEQWRQRFAAAGFTGVEQRRVRAEPTPENEGAWERLEGSLLTFGRR